MASLIWLDERTPLPDPTQALPAGLLAAGGSLSIARLTEAYSKGVFPWFNEGDPVLWWSPDPRMVLNCADFKPSASLRKRLRQLSRDEQSATARMRITTDMAFAQVIQACAEARLSGPGTWISPGVIAAYTAWHQAGCVHSIETWMGGQLVGGLYGVCLGRFFFGESMFSRANDASKLALAYLVRFLQARGIGHIDCQQETNHLSSMGARPITRHAFGVLLAQALDRPAPPWGCGQILQSGELAAFE